MPHWLNRGEFEQTSEVCPTKDMGAYYTAVHGVAKVHQDLPTEQQLHGKNTYFRIFMVLDFASSSLTYFALMWL